MKIYLDVCCLSRPFDNQSQTRVSMESAAIDRILQFVEDTRIIDFSSEMARIEIKRIRDVDRRRKTSTLLPPSERIIPLSEGLLVVAEGVMKLGFMLADAVHIAAARQIGVDCFLTVDEKLLKRAQRYSRQLQVRVINPVFFIQEFNDDADR